MQTQELLDKFEILYPSVADLRRSYTDKDLSSIFRLTNANDDLRKAVMEENLHSIFRIIKNYDVEELRKAITEKNLHSIFRLVEDEDLRKFLLEDNIYKLWPLLRRFTDTQFVDAFKTFFINNIEIDNDCFSRGQLLSKQWLIKELKKINKNLGTVYLCAGWYATLATMLFEHNIKLDKIRSFDIDETCVPIAKIFNKPWLKDNWKFQASTTDINDIDYREHTYQVTRADGTSCYITDQCDTVINTSCEHITNFSTWYNNIPANTILVLQSNNFYEVEEHKNCVNDLKEFDDMTPMQETYYKGKLELNKYTRYMKIGYK